MSRKKFERVQFDILKGFKQFYINSTGTLTILCHLVSQYLIPESFSFDVPLIALVIVSAAFYWNYLTTSLDLCDKGSYSKHVRTLRTSTLNCFNYFIKNKI